MEQERKKCCIEGCERKARSKGYYKEKRLFGKHCDFHHKNVACSSPSIIHQKQLINNDKCEKCGWDESYCDRHRKVPSLGYIPSNVLVLCPNCHRKEHHKKEKQEEGRRGAEKLRKD